ncbi:MAG: Gfo/Idh/MocA family oxidoreductase [Candidatus Hinthialibacter antarcticus]|nr:Gfo/Idh/MocA family oxidoreductase [Candidatus Hinthialibacter antarcticus]
MTVAKPLDRRRFIHSAGAVSALALSNRSIAQANDTINLAVIGVGTQGQELTNACMKIPGVRIQAICDIWETYNLNKTSRILEGFNQEHTTYTNYKDLLEKESGLDAVIIATPDFCHAEQTAACLNAGLHVYCESLMSNTIDGARSMANAAKDSGNLLQIGHQRRSNPYYHYCFDHLINETKLLGKLTASNSQWNRPVQTPRGFPRRFPVEDAVLKANGYSSMQQFRNWSWARELGGGPAAELGSHQFDVMNWYLETTPKSVLATGGVEYYDDGAHEWYDTLMAVFEYETPKGTIRAFYQTLSSNSNFGYFENFMGDEGTLYVSEAAGRVKVYREPNAPDWEKWVKLNILKSPVAPPKEEKKEESESVLDIKESVIPPTYDVPVEFSDPVYQPHLQNFISAMKGEAKLACPAEIAFAATVMTIKLNEAAQKSEKTEFKPEDFIV